MARQWTGLVLGMLALLLLDNRARVEATTFIDQIKNSSCPPKYKLGLCGFRLINNHKSYLDRHDVNKLLDYACRQNDNMLSRKLCNADTIFEHCDRSPKDGRISLFEIHTVSTCLSDCERRGFANLYLRCGL